MMTLRWSLEIDPLWEFEHVCCFFLLWCRFWEVSGPCKSRKLLAVWKLKMFDTRDFGFRVDCEIRRESSPGGLWSFCAYAVEP